MQIDDPTVLNILRRCMVARIATLSRSRRPSINPLYFIYLKGRIWLGTSEWTLAARNVKADSRVSVLFEVEQDSGDAPVLRIRGQATVRTDRQALRPYSRRVMFKYILNPGGMRNMLAHRQQFSLMNRYHAQSDEKGPACLIEVIPEQVEFLSRQGIRAATYSAGKSPAYAGPPARS